MTLGSVLAFTAMLLQTSADVPRPCGSVDREIGRGFYLTQRMFGGSQEFTLAYRPAAGQIRMEGVEDATPFRFIFNQLDLTPSAPLRTGTVGPNIGLANYRFIRADGSRLGPGVMRMECGKGIVLRASFSTGGAIDVPLTAFTPFLNQREHECVRQLMSDGSFRFSIAANETAEPSVLVDDRMDLAWALKETEGMWRAELRSAERGVCRLLPPLVPPF